MEKTMYKKYLERLVRDVVRMNCYARFDKDLLRNHTNYGSATALVGVLVDFGHTVDLCVYGDGEYLVSDKIVVDGKEINV